MSLMIKTLSYKTSNISLRQKNWPLIFFEKKVTYGRIFSRPWYSEQKTVTAGQNFLQAYEFE